MGGLGSGCGHAKTRNWGGIQMPLGTNLVQARRFFVRQCPVITLGFLGIFRIAK
jgi:hypothetical protein